MDNQMGGSLPAGVHQVEEETTRRQLEAHQNSDTSPTAAAAAAATTAVRSTDQSLQATPQETSDAIPTTPTSATTDDEKEKDKEKREPASSSSRSSSDNEKAAQPESHLVHLPDSTSQQDAWAHLPEHERIILKRQLDTPNVKVSYATLFRYASRFDMLIFVVSCLCAVAGGAALPLMTVLFGDLSGTFQDIALQTITKDEFDDTLVQYTLYFVYVAIGEFTTIYIATVGTLWFGDTVSSKLRREYLRAVFRQNMAFFDAVGAGEVTTRITADTNLVQDAISEKVSLTLTGVATLLTAFIIGFVKNATLTGICASSVVALVLTMGIISQFMIKWGKKEIAAYAVGGTVAEEVLGSIRNATAFGTQEKLARQYDGHLLEARRWSWRVKAILGLMIGLMMAIVFWNYGLAFWQGSRLLVSRDADLAAIITICLAIILGAFALGNVAPNGQAFASGVSAAAKIYTTIDRPSPLDPTTTTTTTEGKTLDAVRGDLELRHIKHIYPSRPEVVVMDDVNLSVPAGKTTALVGASGSGKSTIVGLVERFYNPVGGAVYLDGYDVAALNLRWLRQQIALVQQEPVLFSTDIRENIRFGLIGSRFEHEAEEQQQERIYDAAKQANAHDFITSLPEGYDTPVGERGFLLSGGQKQRIAIARAIVSDPKILLLDEATSALDTKSEGVVQAALDNAAQGRTTIVIAHRLSTIKTADNIVVMTDGRIEEQGTHQDLLQRQGAYFKLVNAQRIGDKRQQDASADDDDDDDDDLDRIRTLKSEGRAPDAPEDTKLALGKTNTGKSISSQVLGQGESNKKQQYSLWTLMKYIASFNKQESHYMLLGLFASIISGCCQPAQGVLFAKAIVSLSQPLELADQIRSEVNLWAGLYLMLGFINMIAMLVVGLTFAYCSARLIHRARDKAFRTMMRQDINFFDRDENSAGALTSFLSTETTHLSAISGATLGNILSCITTLVGACAIALAIGWKLALVCIAVMPVLLGAGYLRFWMLARFQAIAKKAFTSSAAYACENTNAIRTVASLNREMDVYRRYDAQLKMQSRRSLKSALQSSLLYAGSSALILLCTALGFWYGGTLIGSGEYSLFQFFISIAEIIFGAQSVGAVFSFAGDMAKAKNAAQELRRLVDRVPAIDHRSSAGEKIVSMDGHIEFRDVHFRYPTRPDVPVLRGLNLDVQPGQYVALVGASGCGKSTTIALMERFYDPLGGGIFVDGQEISRLHLAQYRSFLALVSQEPTLYHGTVRENILLGVTEDDVPEEQIIKACKDANIYDFITSLPDGFSTRLGTKASLLSGGQKQRLAIARALLRNPRILLLDEATSALDSESEKVVQEALDAAALGRTTIAIAHRLSTIQNADVIYVIDQGVVVERGTHAELMADDVDGKGTKGRYRELVELQSLERR